MSPSSFTSNSSLTHLFPILNVLHGFTTCPTLALTNVANVSLSDNALGIHKNTGHLTHNVVNPPMPIALCGNEPPPQVAWEAFYPKGSISPQTEKPGGLGFYLSGPSDFARALENGASEALFSYKVMFQPDWEWVKGGKLPGMYGGVGDLAYKCSGGRQDDRCKCFNLRLMWRASGKGEIYAYMPLNNINTKQLLAVPPKSVLNNDYGISVGKGPYTLSTGLWITIAQRVKLNTPGKTDGAHIIIAIHYSVQAEFVIGEVQLWMNGSCVLHVVGLVMREDAASHIKGMHFQTFFGGHSIDWASPKDQRAWFADVSGAIMH
ncbi:polysaccharide lyase family 14 protein [Serpula lacrymans var. lacrymans S7.3]|uniref:Polysaccharide lyase family 14 protein n=2 Tax=Serpula lacrymans var. lacrymans TaxID=341189 RepID=F8Q2V1_SERL3|nr:polysaccharide lyase family 14 protein [Serpula lacrymans var. lacrymans S7.9]EGN97512.1 polysaccharide lyase family 14 protein [Serpula lacrymans var. lacrymans S7.3]EGO23114.1 polysaccharide lyase family 14 protein [Serpula lacrymans var. lacrymans S7.9]